MNTICRHILTIDIVYRYFQPDVKLSKFLSYLLRHGAEKEGLTLHEGNYVNRTMITMIVTPISTGRTHNSNTCIIVPFLSLNVFQIR